MNSSLKNENALKMCSQSIQDVDEFVSSSDLEKWPISADLLKTTHIKAEIQPE